MLPEGPQTPYEVFCHQCHVTFPVGTRRCIHCGSRVSGSRTSRPAEALPNIEGTLIEEEELPRQRMLSPVALIWVLLAVVGSLYRVCSGGAG